MPQRPGRRRDPPFYIYIKAGDWEIFTRYRDKSFSFTDCTSFALVKRSGIDNAVAIDDDFRAFGIPCLPQDG